MIAEIVLLATTGGAVIGTWPVVGPWIKRNWYSYKIESKLGEHDEVYKNRSPKEWEQYELLDTYEWLCEKALKHDLKELHDKCKERLIDVESRLRKKIRIFFLIGDKQQRNTLTTTILRQNQTQSMFQFEIGYLGKKIDKHFESGLKDVRLQCESISDDSLAGVVGQYDNIIFDAELREPPDDDTADDEDDDLVRIVVTDRKMPRKYYLWGHFDNNKATEKKRDPNCHYDPNKFWVANLAALEPYYEDRQITKEQCLLRIIQRASVLSIVPGLKHQNTYGCLFDNSYLLADARHFISNCFICNRCKKDILNASQIPAGRRSAFLDGIQNWLADSATDAD